MARRMISSTLHRCWRHGWGAGQLHSSAKGSDAFPRLVSIHGTLYYQSLFISQYSTYSRCQEDRANQEQLLLVKKPFMSGKTSKIIAWASFGTIVITIASYFIYHSSERKSPIKATKPDAVLSIKDVGKVSVAVPFRLVNHQGRIVTDRDFTGKWSIFYFGYTSCPDICPDELQKLAEAVDKIEMQINQKVVPVFVTIDPDRDSIAQIRAYLQEFHPRFVGLTGSVDDIRQVAREFRVYFKKTEEEGFDYLIDHSVTMYLMDPNMENVKLFGRDYTSDDLSNAVVQEIRKVN